ncbi:motile sperm domain-containing protein 2-like isoform X2 [Myripristis murdjan]|uniref:motile sperm domain-containing protein 2-like isoform X2 n=1 Tax=Myripristis murdjan TaxID=586833 RepID=UPI00117633E8|nr:motile sperm domain-containing protein 2-like isoform X2 [Myripristis murdjan]
MCYLDAAEQQTMAEDGSTDLKESIQSKIEETREKFRSEYAQEPTDRYESSDLERLWREDGLVESYLEWRHFVVEDALKMIDESLRWRKELNVNEINESCTQKSLLESGMHYLHGYDKEGNKLFWFRVKLLVKDVRLLQEKKKYVAFWLERYVRREPGSLLTVVFDMTDSGLSNVDMDFVKYIINCFQVYYPRLLSKMLVYEIPWIMNAWRIVKSWLGPDAISRLRFVSRSDIQSYIDAEHLPFHMGGTDGFSYSYPPLPDEDFQSPMSESPSQDDETELKDGDVGSTDSFEPAPRPRKVCFADDGGTDAGSRGRATRRPNTTFKSSLLHVSPAEELCFGLREAEKRCLIILQNVTKNAVAYKVRTTAPEKYRVKPSSGSCAAGTSVEITVSLHGGSQSAPQDRFLIMAAEMEPVVTGANQDLAQFWKEIPKSKVMERRLKCHILQSLKPTLNLDNHNYNSPAISNGTNGHQDIHTTLLQVMASSRRLEQKLDRCLWTQKVIIVLVMALAALWCSTLYM